MDIQEMKDIITKEFGINSISSPLGSCTENFLNQRILEIATKNSFPPDIIDIFKKNPYKFGKYQKFDNGTFSGRHFIALLSCLK